MVRLCVRLGERETTTEHPRLCNCGTCKEAAEAAHRQYLKLRENHCPIWVFQIGAALTQLALLDLQENEGERGRKGANLLVDIGFNAIENALVEVGKDVKAAMDAEVKH